METESKTKTIMILIGNMDIIGIIEIADSSDFSASAKFYLKQQISRQRLISKMKLTNTTGSPVITYDRR